LTSSPKSIEHISTRHANLNLHLLFLPNVVECGRSFGFLSSPKPCEEKFEIISNAISKRSFFVGVFKCLREIVFRPLWASWTHVGERRNEENVDNTTQKHNKSKIKQTQEKG
jgi:hypothetical protein